MAALRRDARLLIRRAKRSITSSTSSGVQLAAGARPGLHEIPADGEIEHFRSRGDVKNVAAFRHSLLFVRLCDLLTILRNISSMR